jgi:hypothetical protein
MIKYRMILKNGHIETLDLQEAKEHGNYLTIEYNPEINDIETIIENKL